MTVNDIQTILKAQVLCTGEGLDSQVHTACGSDMMSDVLAFVKDQSVLLTGLVNSQVVRTAEMMDMVCIVFVRGKCPDQEILALAQQRGIAVLTTPYRMFTACGKLYEAGLTMVYLGAESGSDKVLKDICKGETRQQLIDGVRKIEACGMKASVTFISGLAGRDGWEDHAIQTGTMISEMEPSYVGLLTLIVDPSVPMARDIESGKMKLLTPEEVMAETLLMLENTNVSKKCVFRSNHASNYVSLRGDLPDDKEKMMNMLRRAMKNHDMFRDERFRAL